MSRAGLWALALCFAAGCAHAPRRSEAQAPSSLALDYDIHYRASPHAIDVDVRLIGPAREFLFTQEGYVPHVIATAHGREVRIDVAPDGSVPLPEGTSRVRYRYAISRFPLFRMGDLYTGIGEPGSFLVAGRTYLVRPRNAAQVTATLHLRGTDALLPWAPTAPGTWKVSGEDLVDAGFHSFGGKRCEAKVANATLVIALHAGEHRVSDAFACEWIRRSAEEVLTVRRPLPFARVPVHVVPGWGDAPSPVGFMLWSTPPSFAIVLGAGAEEAAFRRDWVALHELLHMVHPSFMHQAPWLSEGLVTYLTEVARMRSGRYSREEGWAELVRGFDRAADDAGDWTLEQTVEGLRRGVYLPVYWAGALLALELDVALRNATGGKGTLDEVLKRLTDRSVTATVEDFGRAVDEVAGRSLWQEVYGRYSTGPVFRHAAPLLKRLGVESSNGGVTFVAAPHSQVREAIGDLAPARDH